MNNIALRIIIIDEVMVNSIYSIHLLLHIYHEILLEMHIVYLLIIWAHINIFLFILTIVTSTEKFWAIVHIFINLLIKILMWLWILIRILILKRFLTAFWKITVRFYRTIISYSVIIIHFKVLPSII